MSDPSSFDAAARLPAVPPGKPGAAQAGEAALAVSSPTPSSVHASSPSTPPVIPDHELLRRVGGGSYGEVWLARNVLGTFRAVKIVNRSRFEKDRPFEREFEGIQKFEPISRSHESQVDILQVGRAEGYFYYVMELADDAQVEIRNPQSAIRNWETYVPRTLKYELQQHGRLPFHDCLRVALALTTALEHLHQHGLIHRDIKPSNIIFVGGVPKLADIGLVTDLDATVSFVGTEGFLPPEGRGSVQADIYSLGKVFYEMATGKDRLDFPEPSTTLGESPERAALVEFNEIILKACAPDPRQRYQTAEQVRCDLVLLQAGKSLQARRRLERRLALAARAAIAAALVALVAFGFSWQWKRAQRQALEQALNQKPKQSPTGLEAPAINVVTVRKLASLQAEKIFSHMSRDGRYVAYQPMGKRQIAIFDTLTGKTNVAATFEKDPPGWAIFSHDGRQIAYETDGSALYVANTDGSGTKQLYKIDSTGGREGFWVPGWSADGQHIIINSWDDKGGRFSTINVKSGEKKDLNIPRSAEEIKGKFLEGMFLSWSGRYLGYHTGGPPWKRKIRLIDLASASESTLVENEVDRIKGWFPDDAKLLFSSDRSGTMDLWAIALRDGKPSGEPELIKGVSGDISLLGVTRDGKLYYHEEQLEVASVFVVSVDFQTGEVLGPPRRATERFAGLQTHPIWSKNGEKLLVPVRGNARVAPRFMRVSLASGEVEEFGTGTFAMNRFQNAWSWSEDGGFLLVLGTYSANGQQGIHRYDLGSGKVETLVRQRDTPDRDWNCLPKLAPDENSFYYVRRKFYENKTTKLGFNCDDRIIRRDLRTGAEAVVYQGPELLNFGCTIELSPDGARLAIATSGETTLADIEKGTWVANIKVVELDRGQSSELIRFGLWEYPHWLAWSPTGEWLVYIKGKTDKRAETTAAPNEVWAINVNSTKRVRIKLPFPMVSSLAIHPDGRQLAFFAATESGGTIDLWVMEGLVPSLSAQKEIGPKEN